MPVVWSLPAPFFFFNDTATTEIYTLSLHDALPISPRIACSPCAPRALLGRRSSRRRRFDERADPELRLEQRAERVAQQLLRLLRGRLEDHVLRDDDARQARDVGQELAQLVVVPDDLEAVPVRVEGRPRLDGLGLDPAGRPAPHLGLG